VNGFPFVRSYRTEDEEEEEEKKKKKKKKNLIFL
jgi:hypothetical protein